MVELRRQRKLLVIGFSLDIIRHRPLERAENGCLEEPIDVPMHYLAYLPEEQRFARRRWLLGRDLVKVNRRPKKASRDREVLGYSIVEIDL